VTSESRVGQSGMLFYDTLFDENATCHIAYGMGLPYAFDGEPGEGCNVSNIHIDFMVGGPELEVDAVLADGTAVPLIRNETWQLS
jgi:aminopeptidase